MFLILKKTVNVVNSQTKNYFVEKLQKYDEIIDEKEKIINSLEEKIKEKEKGNEDNDLGDDISDINFDINVLNYLTGIKYKDDDIYKINKDIDEEFNIDNEKLIKDFVKNVKKDKMFKFCIKIRNKFDAQAIYNLKTSVDYEGELRKMLDDNEFKIYEMFKSVTEDDSIENFIDYLDRLKELNDPKIVIMVGNRDINYNHLNKNIKTKYDESIYKGIKIIYKNKIYDFSLSERNV